MEIRTFTTTLPILFVEIERVKTKSEHLNLFTAEYLSNYMVVYGYCRRLNT